MIWLSVLLIIYIFIRDQVVYDSKYFDTYILYYVISFFSLLVWLYISRVNKSNQIKFIMVFFSLLFCIYFVEIFLNFFIDDIGMNNKDSSRIKIADNLGVKFDKRSRLEVIREHNNKAEDVVPTALAINFVDKSLSSGILPLSGLSNKRTLHCNESGEYVYYDSDRYGFNNPDIEWDNSNKKGSYLLLGDSFTHGACVNEDQTVASRIRHYSNGKTAISLGNGGSGLLLMLATLKEYGKLANPKYTLIMYFEEGNSRLRHENNNKFLKQYLVERNFTQNLPNRQRERDVYIQSFIDTSLEKERVEEIGKDSILKTLLKIIKLFHVRKLISMDSLLVSDGRRVLVDDSFASIIVETKRYAESISNDNILYFVYMPEYSRYIDKDIDHDLFRNKKKIISIIKSLGIPVIDIHHEVFEKHPEPLALFPFKRGGHYNAEGYKLVADTIVKEVEKMFSAK